MKASLNMYGKTNVSEEIVQKVDISTFNLSFFTMIQTDRPKYKPADVVQMRIFFLLPDGTAANQTDIRNFHVEIRNNYDDMLDAFSVKSFESKVYKHKFKLGNEPFEGVYKIHVWTNVHDDNVSVAVDTDNDEAKKIEYEAALAQCEEDFADDDDDKQSCIGLIETNKQIVQQEAATFQGPFDDKISIVQNFTVEKYVLTEFTLNIQTKRIVRPLSTIYLNVSGEYSFGRSVIGKADVYLKIEHKGQTTRIYNTSLVIGLNGASYGIVSIDTQTHLHLVNSIEDYHADITVHFTDDLSQQKVAKYLRVTIAKRDSVKLVLDPVEDFLRPGSSIKMKVHLKDIDGKLIELTTKQVILSVTKKYQLAKCDEIIPGMTNETTLTIGSMKIKNSVAIFETDVPYNTTSMEFEASYDDGKVREKFKVVRLREIAVSRNFVNIQATKPRFYHGKDENFTYSIKTNAVFHATDQLTANDATTEASEKSTAKGPIEIFYVFLISEQGEMKLERKARSPKTIYFKTKIEEWMVPSVNMIVIAHSFFGEFIFDAIKIKVEPKVVSEMKIDILPEKKKSQKLHEFQPGQKLQLKLAATGIDGTVSSLHILSVDERVRYFGNDNDITKEKLRKLVDLNSVKKFACVTDRYDDRYNDLSKFNAFFITNAYVKEKDCSFIAKSSGLAINNDEETEETGTKRDESSPVVRTEFPETFLFEDFAGSVLDENNEFTYETTAPHAISSFLVNGFVYHPVHGIAIAKEKKFTVIKEFFVKVFLPYSIRVGEVTKLNVAAFNYLKNAVSAKITVEIPELDIISDLSEQASYEFVSVSKSNNICQINQLTVKTQTKTVSIAINKGSSADFFIRGLSEGKLTLKITAFAQDRNDSMIRTLKVEPHGHKKSINSGLFIDLRNSNHTSHSFYCEFPSNIIENTKKVFATSYGNILGPVLTNTDAMIMLPDGKLFFSKYI